MTTFTIETTPDELDLGLCVSSGQTFRWDRLPDGRWLGVDGSNWYLADQKEDRIEIQTNGTKADFASLFRLETKLVAVEAKIIEKGPELAPYIGNLRGLRVLKPECAHEVLFSFLCTPNNNMVRIKKMVDSLSAYGEKLAQIEGKDLTVFPSIERIAQIEESDLRSKGFGYRAATIPHVARQILTKPTNWLKNLQNESYETGFEALCTLKGIGPKLADCISLFALRKLEAAPLDTHLWQAYCRLYRPDLRDKPITDKRYKEAGDFFRSRFGELTGWAHQYLFYDNALNWRDRARLSSVGE